MPDARAPHKNLQEMEDFALTGARMAVFCSSANGGPGLPRGVLLGSTRAAFVGFSKRAASVVERKGERLIFDSAILDFVHHDGFFQILKSRR